MFMFFRGTSDFFAFYFLKYILLSLFHCVRACDGYTYKQYGTEYEHLQGNILVPDSPQLSHRSLQAFSTDKYRSWCALYCGQRTIIKAQLGEYISLLTEVYDSKCHTQRERERDATKSVIISRLWESRYEVNRRKCLQVGVARYLTEDGSS